MSLDYRINVTVDMDGDTEIDLSDESLFSEANGVRTGTFTEAGVFTFTNLNQNDYFMHVVTIARDDLGDAAIASIRGPEPSGIVGAPVDQVLPTAGDVANNPSYNIYFPQASGLVCQITGVTLTGIIFFSMSAVPPQRWASVQCCGIHRPIVPPPV